MADSESRLFVFLIFFWTFLTIFSNVFSNYLEEPISSDITNFVPNNENIIIENNLSPWEKFISGIYDTLDDIPIINNFTPILKLLTFGYTDKIPGIVTVFLQATLILTTYIVWRTIKG